MLAILLRLGDFFVNWSGSLCLEAVKACATGPSQCQTQKSYSLQQDKVVETVVHSARHYLPARIFGLKKPHFDHRETQSNVWRRRNRTMTTPSYLSSLNLCWEEPVPDSHQGAQLGSSFPNAGQHPDDDFVRQFVNFDPAASFTPISPSDFDLQQPFSDQTQPQHRTFESAFGLPDLSSGPTPSSSGASPAWLDDAQNSSSEPVNKKLKAVEPAAAVEQPKTEQQKAKRGGQNKKNKLPPNAESLDADELANHIAMEEDKRRRNTAASGEPHWAPRCKWRTDTVQIQLDSVSRRRNERLPCVRRTRSSSRRSKTSSKNCRTSEMKTAGCVDWSSSRLASFYL